MSPAFAVLWMALQAGPPEPPAVRYPLDLPPSPDFLAPGQPFQLVDLSYDLRDTFSTRHAFSARLRVRDGGYLTAGFEGERRDLVLSTQRLDLVASSEEGSYDFFGRYRAPWLVATAGGRRHGRGEGEGWRLGGSLAGRLSPSFELLGRLDGETSAPDDRFLRFASLRFLWQRGPGFEAAGEASHERVRTEGGLDNTRDAGTLGLVGLAWGAELSGTARLERTRGRFPREEGDAAMAARVPIRSRLLAEGGIRSRYEVGVKRTYYEYRGALTWFGRRLTLPRAGEAAARARDLSRRATAMGYNERLVFDDDGLRALRERLSLSPRRDELLDGMAAVYAAQVQERTLPLLGVEYVYQSDALTGTSVETVRAIAGMPWPPAWPWSAGADATPFLRLDVEWQRHVSGPAFAADAHGLALTVSLNREMDLVLRWRRSDPTALDAIQGVGRPRTFELSYVYARGR